MKKNHQKFLKNHQKIYQKILPGLAKKYIFPIKLKIITNLFSIKLKKKKIFFWDLKNENLKTGAQDRSVQSSQIFGRHKIGKSRDKKTSYENFFHLLRGRYDAHTQRKTKGLGPHYRKKKKKKKKNLKEVSH